jgi:hypothetical protein
LIIIQNDFLKYAVVNIFRAMQRVFIKRFVACLRKARTYSSADAPVRYMLYIIS